MVIPQTGGTGFRCLIECIPCSRLIGPSLEYRMGLRASNTVTTANRVPANARSDPDEGDSSSSGEDDDPVVAAYVFFRLPSAVVPNVDDICVSHT